MPSLAGTFDIVAPHLPDALVSSTARARARAVAASLPAALSRCLYLECRPGHPESADLIVDVDVAGRDILAGRNAVVSLDARHDTLAWRGIVQMMRTWTDPSSRLHRAFVGAWLEFDLPDDGSSLPSPSLFVDFAPELGNCEAMAALVAAARLAGDREVPASAFEAIALLPSHATLLYAGIMLARESAPLRLCVMGLANGELAAWLRAAHWPGDVGGLATLLSDLACDGDQSQPAIVHLDAGDALRPGIGLEYPFARRPQLSGTIAEQRLLDALEARALIATVQRAALSTWTGADRRTMPHELWPSLLVRRVNHVKLVQAGDAVRAKLYLCAEHVPATRVTAE